MAEFAIRSHTLTDLALVFSSWLRSMPPARDVSRDVHFRGQHALIEAILARPGALLRVACVPDDPEVILGWACVEHAPHDASGHPSLVHFAYVKDAFRRRGIARALLADVAPRCRYTHRPHSVDVHALHLAHVAVYDPCAAVFPALEHS
jgi:GNAT superfamily N-acetyltransferase